MSFSTTTAASGSPTSSDTPPSASQSNSLPNQPPQSSSLYLFTFLATLLLLLAVSCAIVIRSFILRRRFRRRIEEALAAGVLIPGTLDDGPGGLGRGRRRDFGEKPKLWEVWVDEHEQGHDSAPESGPEDDNLGKGEGTWEEILPVSATILSSNTPKPTSLTAESTASFPSSERQNTRRSFASRLGSRWPFNRSAPLAAQRSREAQNESSTGLTSDTAAYPPSPPKERQKEDERLQVSVLISMPNPNARRTYGSDAGGTDSDISMKGKGRGPSYDDNDGEGEAEIPDVVFGVAEVGFRS